MAIQLSNFEQQIDPTILKRGYEYFKNGYVTDVEDLGHGDYEATVEGSDTYTVSLHIEGDEVTDYECDCPYDWGPVCKHVAAVLFYLQKDLLETDIPLQKEKRNKPKKESEAAQFEKLLKQLTHEELKTFICDVCAKDKSLRRLFIAKHLSRLYPVSKELYDKQVKKLVETYADQYGFIDYQESSQLSSAVYEMIEEARRCVKTGEKDKALYMSEAIIEGMYKTIDNADDSDGEIGGCLEEAFDVLSELSKKDMDESLHNEMSGWLLRHYEAGSMKGWDWHTDLMRIAIGMVKTEEEKKRKEAERKERIRRERAEQKRIADEMRRAELARITGAPQVQSGQVGKTTGTPGTRVRNVTGTASAQYAASVITCIRPNIFYAVPPGIERGQHQAVYRVNLLPNGEQTGNPVQLKSSGLPAYDHAVETAIRRCNPFPRPKDQSATVPRSMQITFDPVEDNANN